ncbi:hypothetical protein E3V33_01420 [Candidatus Marinimicrobia bacterium MT.SAG.4]|nr:hypothetical protein E3V33_01420 [Candidatus Marinimicrobia bacterium MT.SAG.4]
MIQTFLKNKKEISANRKLNPIHSPGEPVGRNRNLNKEIVVRTVYILVILLLLTSCGTGKVIIPEIQNDFTLRSNYDDVWSAIIESLAEAIAPIESIEKESGLVTTHFVLFFNNYSERAELDRIAEKPDYGFLASWQRGRLKYNVFVRSLSDSLCSIKITSYMEAREDVLIKDWVVVHSRGIIEGELFESIKSKLRGVRND